MYQNSLNLRKWLMCLIVFVVITALPTVFVLKELGPYRAYFGVSLFIVVGALLLKTNVKLPKSILVAYLGFILIAFVYQFITVKQYANAVDERIDYLINQPDTNTVISVKSLPDAGMLFSGEITTNAQHYHNKHLKNGLGLKFDVVLAEGKKD